MSLTGLNEGDFTSINVLRSIGLGNRAGRGTNNQVIKSDGINANWGDIASSDIIQGSSTIQVDTSTDPDTLNCLKVPRPLRAGSNVAFADSEGTIVSSYDGSVDTTIATQNDVYTGGTGIDISGSNEITTNVKSLTLSGTAVQSSPQTFNPNADGGTQTITINDTNDVYTAGNGIQISGSNQIRADTDNDTIRASGGGSGNKLNVQKVPNALTAGTNISFSTGSTYDGSTAITISSTDTNTEYTGSGAILLTGTNFTLSVSGLQGLDFSGIQEEADASTGELYQVEIEDASRNLHQVLAIKQ